MASHDPRIDAYIAKSADFARPILERLRSIVHEACPDVEETIKWGAPNFVHAGGIVCMMAAFKQHASFGFWKQALVVGEDAGRQGMGSIGKLTSVKDLPPKKQLLAWIRKAVDLNVQGIKAPGGRKTSKPKPPPVVPPELVAALKKDRKARAAWDAFAPSHQREYIDWINDAKRDETRVKRLAQAMEWVAQGKSRNWKYTNC